MLAAVPNAGSYATCWQLRHMLEAAPHARSCVKRMHSGKGDVTGVDDWAMQAWPQGVDKVLQASSFEADCQQGYWWGMQRLYSGSSAMALQLSLSGQLHHNMLQA